MFLKEKIRNFLLWSQKYTQTDMLYLAKGGFWLTLGQLISIATSFLLALAFANLLDQTTYGSYQYLLSLFGILTIFALPGLGMATTQATARGLEGSFYTGFKTKLKWGLLASLFALLGASYYFFRGSQHLSIPLLISAIFLPLMFSAPIYGSFLAGRKLFSIQVKYILLAQIISALLLISALFFTKNLFWLIAIYLISNTSLDYLFYLITKKRFQPNKKEDAQTLSYGKHLSLIEVISIADEHLDKILLFTLVGSVPLAVYYFASAIPDQIKGILKQINALALPKFSVRPREEIKKTIMNKFWRVFFVVLVIVVLYFILAPYIYKIFFPRYSNSIPYSQALIFSLLAFPNFLFTTSFQAKMMKKELYLLQIIPSLRIILYLCLIPFFGLWGIIGAIIGTKLFSLILAAFLFRKF